MGSATAAAAASSLRVWLLLALCVTSHLDGVQAATTRSQRTRAAGGPGVSRAAASPAELQTNFQVEVKDGPPGEPASGRGPKAGAVPVQPAVLAAPQAPTEVEPLQGAAGSGGTPPPAGPGLFEYVKGAAPILLDRVGENLRSRYEHRDDPRHDNGSHQRGRAKLAKRVMETVGIDIDRLVPSHAVQQRSRTPSRARLPSTLLESNNREERSDLEESSDTSFNIVGPTLICLVGFVLMNGANGMRPGESINFAGKEFFASSADGSSMSSGSQQAEVQGDGVGVKMNKLFDRLGRAIFWVGFAGGGLTSTFSFWQPFELLEMSTTLRLIHLALGLVMLSQGSSVTSSNDGRSADKYKEYSTQDGDFAPAKVSSSSSQAPVLVPDNDEEGEVVQEEKLKMFRIGLGMMLLGVGILW